MTEFLTTQWKFIILLEIFKMHVFFKSLKSKNWNVILDFNLGIVIDSLMCI